MGMTPGYNHRLRLHNTLPSVLSRRQLQLPAPHLLSENIVAPQQGYLRNPPGGQHVIVFLVFCPFAEMKIKRRRPNLLPRPPSLCLRAALVVCVGAPALPLAAVRGRT